MSYQYPYGAGAAFGSMYSGIHNRNNYRGGGHPGFGGAYYGMFQGRPSRHDRSYGSLPSRRHRSFDSMPSSRSSSSRHSWQTDRQPSGGWIPRATRNFRAGQGWYEWY